MHSIVEHDWSASWYMSPQDHDEPLLPPAPQLSPRTLANCTLRQVIPISAGGARLRLMLSNVWGGVPLQVDAVQLALSAGGDAIAPDSAREVLFEGRNSVCVPPGGVIWSDPVGIAVAAHAKLAISMFLMQPAPLGTVHRTANQTAYIGAGNQLAAASMTAPETTELCCWIGAVDVAGAARPNVIVAFGDSLTDGFLSTVNTSRGYPAQLSRLLNGSAGAAAYSVVSAAITGNRWKNDRFGLRGEARFSTDVLQRSGATHAIIMMGINDIGFGLFMPEQEVSATGLVAAIRGSASAAIGKGMVVLLGTLAPFKKAGYYSPEGEQKRQAVNAWIRANELGCAVVDFERALQDPADPLALASAFDSGDGLHPNDAGYAAMAAAAHQAFASADRYRQASMALS